MKSRQHRRLSYLVLVLSIVFAMSSTVLAAGDSDFVVRAAGMGGAYTALSSGPAGLLYNPAGIGLRFFEVTANISAPSVDDLETLGMLLQDFDPNKYKEYPNSIEVAGMTGLSIGPIAVAGKARAIAYVEEGASSDFVSVYAMPEAAAGLGFYVFKTGLVNLRLGVSGHYLQATSAYYEVVDNEIVAESMVNGKGQYFTLGALADITPFLSLGFTARNIAGTFTWEGEPELKQEPVYTLGAAIKLPTPFIGLTLAADADSNEELRYGAEVNILSNLISLRVGQSKQSPGLGPVSVGGTVTTAGASLNLGPLTAGVAASTYPGEKLNLDGIERVIVEGTLRF
jgi:hypothetical protein